jgi:hypothetical protein
VRYERKASPEQCIASQLATSTRTARTASSTRRHGRGTVPLLTLFSVEHTNELDRTVIGNPLVELPSTGRSNRLGGQYNRLGQEERQKPRFAASRGTPPRIVCVGLF